MRYLSAFLLLFQLCHLTSFAQGTATNAEIQQQLARIFDDPAYFRAFWAVQVQSMDTGEILFEKNANKLLTPASNMKLLTAVAAIERLGLGFKWETSLATNSKIVNGRLSGNLVVIGSGDPTIGTRFGMEQGAGESSNDPRSVFRLWAGALKSQGIRIIEGDLLGDDNIFDNLPLGYGWAWDNLPYGYSAEIGGLPFSENLVRLTLIPGRALGDECTIRVSPQTDYLTVTSQLKTIEPWKDPNYWIQRGLGTNQAIVHGSLPAGLDPVKMSAAVDNPTKYFLTVLKETLEQEGIEVRGEITDVDDLAEAPPAPSEILLKHTSPPLRSILRHFLKSSQNLYGETLIRLLDPKPSDKSYAGGREEVIETLTQIGIPDDSYVLSDGSGLSRYNFVSADAIVRLLHYVYRKPYKDAFLDYLPLAGVDGTISRRMKGTAAENNVRAKTGTLSHVRALSGYVLTRDGETLAFSMIVNNYTQPRRSAEYLQDLALEYLANLKR